jgi:hypothetical protein
MRKDTSQMAFLVGFLASDPGLIKEYYICIGSANDSSDIAMQKIKFKEKDGRQYTTGFRDMPVAGHQVVAVVSFPRSRFHDIRKLDIYIKEKNGPSQKKLKIKI